MWASPQITGVMPVAGSLAKSPAMIAAVPRRNAYGEAIIRPIRTGMSHASRSSCAAITWSTGSTRSSAGRHAPRDERGTVRRSARPSA